MGQSDPHMGPLAHWPLANDCREATGKTLHGSNTGAVYGSLADVRIYDRALSAAEVQSLGVG